MIKISVCVPVYGVEKFIERCARTLFEQTLKEGVEFIFVNDCTRDNSVTILRNVLQQYPQRIPQTRVIDHEANQGLSAARNTAVAAAAGEYVLHLDSDDFIALNALADMLKNAEREQADIVVGDLIWYWSEDRKVIYRKYFTDRTDFLYRVLTRKVQCGIVGNLIKRSLYTDHNITTPKLNMGEDYVTTPRLAFFAQNIVSHPLAVYYYEKSNDSAMSRTPDLAKLQDLISGHDYLADFLQKQNDSDKYTAWIKEMRRENFAIMLEYSVTAVEHLRYLRKNFLCRTLLSGKNYSFKLKIANLLFQANLLHGIVWGTSLLKFLRSAGKR